MALSPPLALSLIRQDLSTTSATETDRKTPDLNASPKLLSTFTDEATERVIFTAEHGWNEGTERFESRLWMRERLLGTVTLKTIELADGSKEVATSTFYSRPSCFSSKRLFQAAPGCRRMYWKPEREGEELKLLEYKSKIVLARCEVLDRVDGIILPTKRVLPHLASLLAELPPPQARLNRTRTTLSPALLATAPSLTLNRPLFSLPPPSSPSSFDSPSPSTPCFSRLATRASSLLSTSTSTSSSSSEEKGKCKETSCDPSLVICLLTLLYQDYLLVQRVKEEEREREERGMEWDAW